MKIKSKKFAINIKNIVTLLFFTFFTILIWLVLNIKLVGTGYLFFIEFNNAHGIKQGTSLRMRGVDIGYIKNIKVDLNSVIVLASINSKSTLIPRNSIVETNQTGLLNDTVIDIIPLEKIKLTKYQQIDVLSQECIKSDLICHLNFIEGDRGLNYDDLIRSATRISQRFDDPSFFHILYVLLQNSIELSDDLINMASDVSSLVQLFSNYTFRILLGRV